MQEATPFNIAYKINESDIKKCKAIIKVDMQHQQTSILFIVPFTLSATLTHVYTLWIVVISRERIYVEQREIFVLIRISIPAH